MLGVVIVALAVSAYSLPRRWMWKLLAALWRPILHGLPEAIQFERVAE